MKICKFNHGGQAFFGEIHEGFVTPLTVSPFDETLRPGDLPDQIPIGDLVFSIPLTPSKIVCVGRNYADHAKELGNEVPYSPLLFLKAPSALIYHEDFILLPEQSVQVEHEGELGVVIGRKCKSITPDSNPLDYVFGYICMNDVTARDVQRRDVQFTRGKSFDTFCPVGPYIETVLDTSDLGIITRVNGEIRQDGRTSQMIFDIPFLVRYISDQMTLNPGDIIATGTPAGVSVLNEGDVCEVEIEGIGILRNTVKK